MGDAGNEHYDIAQIGLWYGCNYGAILTTYALYRYFSGMGKRVLLLNQAPIAANPLYMDTNNISYRFMARHGVECSSPLESDADLMGLNDIVDTFVVGSDQVWRWEYSQNQGLFYFLDFVRGTRRKIAYSASFGVDREKRPAASLAKAKYYLQAFDAVSVRENSGVEILENVYGVQGEWQPDPVFLHSADFYCKLAAGEEVEHEPYLFAYVLDMTPEISTLVESVAGRLGLKVRVMEDGQRKAGQCGGGIIPMPEEWLREIAHCSYFVTDSFHGVCFAHIFNKDFVCTAPVTRGQTRFESLLGYTGLNGRLVSGKPVEDAVAIALGGIEWSSVNSKIAAAQAAAHVWLQQALVTQRDPMRVSLGNLAYETLYRGQGARDRILGAAELADLSVRRMARSVLSKWMRLKAFAYGIVSCLTFGGTRWKYVSKKNVLLRVSCLLRSF